MVNFWQEKVSFAKTKFQEPYHSRVFANETFPKKRLKLQKQKICPKRPRKK